MTGPADRWRPVTMWAVAAIVLAAMHSILLLRAGVLRPSAALLTLALFVTPALAGALLGGGDVTGVTSEMGGEEVPG